MPEAAQAARVPIRGASRAIASSVTLDPGPVSAPSEIVSKSACSFDWTSTTKRALASSCSSLAFSFCSRAICASRGSAAGRPRGRSGPASVPASRARRHSITWLEYRPSRRSTAPFSPVAAASYSATTSSLYCAVKPPPAAPLGHLRIRALPPLAGHPSSIAGHQGTVELGHGHLGNISIPAFGVVSCYWGAGASRQLGREGHALSS